MKLTKLLSTAAVGAFVLAGAAVAENYSDHRAVLSYAEYITAPGADEAGGITVFQHDLGNGQLGADFVYNDPRRALFNGGNAEVTYAVQTDFLSSDPGLSDQVGDMYGAVAVWDDQTCSDMMLVETASSGKGVVDRFFEGSGIIPDWTADVTQIGFLDSSTFEYFAPGSSVLGVAFTLTWVDGLGNPTDIDNNGKADVAFREIYYNDDYPWSDNGVANIDFPSVANHEMGHGFSMAHFGLIALDNNGALFVKPQALMNAVYSGPAPDPTGRDVGSHCSNWSQWPNN